MKSPVMAYKTVLGAGEAEIIEKRSRFIAQVSPACDEAAALEFIAQIKKRRYDARHNVFAFITGTGGETIRQSDDGEPGGTAGLPSLGALKSAGVTNTVVVVTRYFGGTLLGAGGLTRAYGKAARDGLLAAGIVEKHLCRRITLKTPYAAAGKVRYELERAGFIISETVYAENPEMILFVPEHSVNALTSLAADLTGGAAGVFPGESTYVQLETPHTLQ